MAMYIAYNSALSTTTGIAAGTSYATGAKVALQLQVPDAGQIQLVEWGVSFDGSAAATPALLEVATTDTASTVSTGHTTTTVKPLTDPNAAPSRLTMGTTGTGFGNGAITSNTTLRMVDRQYVAPTNQYVKMWPLGNYPMIGNAATENFLQFRINTSATVNAIVYAVWIELI
jgi:hypothetical protein